MRNRGATLALAVLVVLFAASGLWARTRVERRPGSPGVLPELSSGARAGTLRFAPDAAPLDRQLVLDAIARARPEARALIDRVEGAVLVHVGSAGAGRLGLTEQRGGHFDVTLDLATVLRSSGERGVSRLVLHELGHVVDGALVPPALDSRFDAGIPRGYACDPGQADAACAPRPERFAETFAKWATGDIGLDLYLGYKVPPPDSLEEWGRPLARLAVAP